MRVREFLNEIRVFDCGFTKARFGNRNDGGYVLLLEPCRIADTLYSFGIGDDVSFELDFVRRFLKINVELFDPTIVRLPQGHERFTFHKQGVGKGYGYEFGVRHNAILKMDVEWHEWDALMAIPLWELNQFGQMVVEFHILDVAMRDNLSPYFQGLYGCVVDRLNEELFSQYQYVLELINRRFYCFHAHANNSLPMVTLDGYTFPPLLEMSFIRKDLVDSAVPYQGMLPVDGLDYPNKIDRPDIIGWYPLTTGEENAE